MLLLDKADQPLSGFIPFMQSGSLAESHKQQKCYCWTKQINLFQDLYHSCNLAHLLNHTSNRNVTVGQSRSTSFRIYTIHAIWLTCWITQATEMLLLDKADQPLSGFTLFTQFASKSCLEYRLTTTAVLRCASGGVYVADSSATAISLTTFRYLLHLKWQTSQLPFELFCSRYVNVVLTGQKQPIRSQKMFIVVKMGQNWWEIGGKRNSALLQKSEFVEDSSCTSFASLILFHLLADKN